MMQTAVGKVDDLASSPTFSRLETRATRTDVMAINRVLVEQFILKTSPQRREGAKIARETTGGSYLTIHPVGGDGR